MQTLNLGYNSLGDEGLIGMIPSGLERNRTLLHLGLQETGLTCTGVISLAESLATGTGLQRVDLRKNNFQLAGLMALAAALKLCPTVTRVDLLNATPPSIEVTCKSVSKLWLWMNEVNDFGSIDHFRIPETGEGDCGLLRLP